MATSHYDVNVQLALATTAEHEGDLEMALEFLAAANRAAKDTDRLRVFWAASRFRARNIAALSLRKRTSLALLTATL